MCPYMAGGRSRRGSPKAGTSVVVPIDVLDFVLFVSNKPTLDACKPFLIYLPLPPCYDVMNWDVAGVSVTS